MEILNRRIDIQGGVSTPTVPVYRRLTSSTIKEDYEVIDNAMQNQIPIICYTTSTSAGHRSVARQSTLVTAAGSYGGKRAYLVVFVDQHTGGLNKLDLNVYRYKGDGTRETYQITLDETATT